MVRALFVFIFLFSSISYAEKASKAEMNKNLKSSYDRVVSLEQFISEYYSAASPKDLKSINKIFSGYDFENKPDMTIVKNIITLKKNDKSVEIEINTDDGTVIYLNEYRVNLDNSDPFLETYAGSLSYYLRILKRKKFSILNFLIPEAMAYSVKLDSEVSEMAFAAKAIIDKVKPKKLETMKTLRAVQRGPSNSRQ